MADATQSRRPGMILLSGGIFWMGSDDHYPEERPAHPVAVDPFWIDEVPVTNRQFADFVAATGYVTSAERPPDPADYPGADPELLSPASLVFEPPLAGVALRHFTQWWDYRSDADWRHPLGPGSSLDGLDDHPVVHIAFEDAQAYATWAGKVLPTEAEWEFAARGGLDRSEYAWGDEFMPGGVPQANTWQGEFPTHNSMIDGHMRTSPVRSFPANPFGLFDMIGNVWEWTADYFADHHPEAPLKTCCAVARLHEQMRCLSYILHPPELERYGLVGALEALVLGMSARTGIDISFQVRGHRDGLLPEMELAVLRIAQESLMNVFRHSGSQRAEVRLHCTCNWLCLRVRDYGLGDKARDAIRSGLGVGMRAMAERMEEVGGRVRISLFEHGTAVSAIVPNPRRICPVTDCPSSCPGAVG